MLAGVAHVTTYLVDSVLTDDQREALVEWLASRASESNAPGRAFMSQLGANISEQARFVELMHRVGQEFMDEKIKAIREGNPIL
jgi:hypothetical protein